MLKLYSCVADGHDLRLVGLAAAICIVASLAAVNLLRHARKSTGNARLGWTVISAISTGFGIWATHFVAMLAFEPGVAVGYNVSLTVLSLFAAIVLTAAGLYIALLPSLRIGPALGGAIVAGGIASMHYLGMAAYEVAGSLTWDPAYVITSIVLGCAIGAIALPVSLHSDRLAWKIGGAGLLTLAICSHHFTGMTAVSIVPDPRIVVPESTLPAGWLAAAVACASFVIIGLGLAAILLDIRDARRSALEVDRMRDLADASVEGLLVCDGETIVSVNTSFAHLVGTTATELVGKQLDICFPDRPARTLLLAGTNQAIETGLRHSNGSQSAVELLLRPIVYSGRPHHVIAVRDLQARKEAEQHIHFLAHHDALTGLPNRSFFNMRLEQDIAALHPSDNLAVLCLDLDRFKEVNDLFGHAAGDTVLKTVAKRVNAVLEDGQIMARLGGDEFAILVPRAASTTELARIAETVLDALRAPSEIPEVNVISTSIGIAIYPEDGSDRETLLSRADTALYRAKTEGRSTYRFYEASMGAAVRERRMLEHDLRLAIARNELRLVYQPQHDAATQEMTGFEALLRWRHPTRGDVSPADFIPIAEETGTILEIGDWVIRKACEEAATWDRPLTVAVNVSAVQLYKPDFVQHLHETLLQTGLPPKRLEIEITETALIRDFNRALATLRLTKALGVRIAMDDFGTGYSSLSNLRTFPFDKIKIDGSFIRMVNANGQSATIVRAVLGLGKGLGLPVVAEGVETEAELQFLRDENCDQVQGYLLGRPALIEHFRRHTSGVDTDEPPVDAPERQAKIA